MLAISFQKQPIIYSLLINPSSLFSIQQESGEISLTRALDYESDQRRYLLMVRANEDHGSLSTATEVSFIRIMWSKLLNVSHEKCRHYGKMIPMLRDPVLYSNYNMSLKGFFLPWLNFTQIKMPLILCPWKRGRPTGFLSNARCLKLSDKAAMLWTQH